ncbi:MAG: cellulase family glycosylhydrolase [Candidatus Hydrogenedentes bacterium]|nr:cellulase family glycosylhydrolase [Candidatus Hydrogenedentota bacterium]
MTVTEGVTVTVGERVVATVAPGFLGLHYDGPEHQAWDPVRQRPLSLAGAYGSPAARASLHGIGVGCARIFVDVPGVHPDAGTFNWERTDTAVGEVAESGMDVMLCLHQGGPEWLGGSSERPWWELDEGRAAWRAAVAACAARYRGKVRYYEILNEPNLIKDGEAGFMGWERSVDLYLSAAEAIKQAEPGALCGGAATWAGWESGAWAARVLARPGGEALLDFVSYHIYTSHNLDDADAAILSKVGWFEQAPRHIRAELAGLTDKRVQIVLTEFNTSAVFSKDGKPYTDPRDVNVFGGLVSALALLHSATGGCDMAMHYSTSGGFGLLVWPPLYDRQPAYYAVALLREAAGFAPGAELLDVETSEPPKAAPHCVKGESETYDLQPFAVRSASGTAVVLINKQRDAAVAAQIRFTGENASSEAQVYVYSAMRVADAVYPASAVTAVGGVFEVECAPYSITVVK